MWSLISARLSLLNFVPKLLEVRPVVQEKNADTIKVSSNTKTKV